MTNKNSLENYIPGTHDKNNPFEFNGTYEEFLKIPFHSYINAAINDSGSFYKKDFIKIKCEDCGVEITNQVASYYHFEERIKKEEVDPIMRGFFCKSCKIKKRYQKNFGVDSPQQLDSVKKLNKETFYKNHPEFIPYSEDAVYYEGTLDNLMNFPYQWNKKIKFTCSRCGKENIINFGTLRARYQKWIELGKDTSLLFCKKCAKETAIHPDMVPLIEEPIEWKGTVEELLKKALYDDQRIKFTCEDCGKEVINRFAVFKWRGKKRLICDRCRIEETCCNLYGAPSYNERNIPEETRKIINDEEKLREYIAKFKGYNSDYIAGQLNISPITFRSHLNSFRIDMPVSPRSSAEKEICSILDSLEVKYISNSKSIIAPYELDIYIPDRRIAIEFNGNYWHSSSQISSRSLSYNNGKYYHQNKSKLCQENNIRLIHIFEYEWDNKKEKIISYLKNILLPCAEIGARLCEVKEISFKESEAFENLYHLQGSAHSKVRVGLFYNNELISEMTFGKSRFRKDCEWELIRYVCKEGYKIIGGASKLYKYFIKSYKPSSVVSYCNYGKFEGTLYEKLGFEFIGLTEPGYVWVKNKEVLSRSQCQKHKLKEYEGNTEKEKMTGRGFMKIYDAGNLVYIQK